MIRVCFTVGFSTSLPEFDVKTSLVVNNRFGLVVGLIHSFGEFQTSNSLIPFHLSLAGTIPGTYRSATIENLLEVWVVNSHDAVM